MDHINKSFDKRLGELLLGTINEDLELIKDFIKLELKDRKYPYKAPDKADKLMDELVTIGFKLKEIKASFLK